MEPLVSVVIPMYNRENTIRRAIESVINQTYKNIEIIVVDDNSTDASVRIVEEYVGDRVKLILLPHNSGANAARNAGIREAKGDYIAFQDSDDEWLPDKLTIQMDCMLNEGYKALFCPYTLVSYGNLAKQFPEANVIQRVKEGGVVSILRYVNLASTQTLVIAREVTEAVGVFDESMPRLQDYEYMIRIAQMYDIGCVEQSLVNVYRQEQSITTNQNAYFKAVEIMLEKHGDFLNIKSFLKRTRPLNIIENDETFHAEVEQLRKLYAKDDHSRENDFNVAMITALGQKYMALKRGQRDYIESRIMQLQDKKFAIYGAGKIGQEVCDMLRHKNLHPKFFIVSKFQENTVPYIGDIPIKEVSGVNDKKIEIIIAVSPGCQKEILKNLRECGLEHYFIWDEVLNI